MRRRDFLEVAALAATLAGCSLPKARAAAAKQVVVIGAGLAGLAAGYELVRAGHRVTVVEASAQPGGRIQTLREPFSDGLHAEAGGQFVLANHDLTLRYAGLFELPLEPALPAFESRLFYVRGRRVTEDSQWPFDLTAEERRLGYRGLWQKYVAAPADEADASALDTMSAAELLRSRGASPAVIALLRLGYLDMFGDGIESYSALQMMQRLSLVQSAGRALGRLVIRGGSDRLTRALAARLGETIQYSAPVVRIEWGGDSASIVVAAGSGYRRLTADQVILAIPFSALRRVDLSPGLSPAKRRVIQELSHTSVVRIFLQFGRKRWTAEGLHLQTITDLPIRWIFEHTAQQGGRRGILEAQALGADARRLAAMQEAGRIRFALAQLGQIFPGLPDDYERGISKSWDDDPWALGAFPYFRPGQMLAFQPHLARPEGCLHFAGDQTSVWSGWMQGALESGIRAAREISLPS